MGNPVWLGIDHLRFGLIGAPVCLVVMVVVSLMTALMTPALKWLTVRILAEKLFLVDNTKTVEINLIFKRGEKKFAPFFVSIMIM